MENAKLLSPSVWAFVGDAVYDLLVRTKLSSVNRPSRELHKLSVEYVSATAQARAFEIIEPLLSNEEADIFKRGRNFHTSRVPKNATNKEYHTATGLEALFGYLYLCGKQERINSLFETVWNGNEQK